MGGARGGGKNGVESKDITGAWRVPTRNPFLDFLVPTLTEFQWYSQEVDRIP